MINLVPDKLAVFREIVRVLKPGGRVALSDIALKQELPPEVKQSVEAYVGCISGAILIEEYRSLLEQAGFASVVVTDTGSDLNAYAMADNDPAAKVAARWARVDHAIVRCQCIRGQRASSCFKKIV